MKESATHDWQRVAIVTYDGLKLFEFGIVTAAFCQPRTMIDPWYESVIVAAEPSPFSLGDGMTASVAMGLEGLETAGTIVIPGWRDPNETPPAALRDALAKAAARGARFVSICAGAFVLAAAGLLDGRRATTHWAYARAFQRRFPNVTLEADVLYLDDGQIITSAGSAAGIDTCLHLIRRDFGAETANRVARAMVVPPHREGGQAQYVEAPVNIRPGPALGQVLEWARARLDRPITVAAMAEQAAMSRRTLLRRFVETTGMSPKTWLDRERLHRAQTLLETSAAPLEQIADACGFNSLESFRAAFRRTLSVSPAAYRKRFSVATAERHPDFGLTKNPRTSADAKKKSTKPMSEYP